MGSIKGWPLSDPYPFREPPAKKETPDCDFVIRDKEYAKSVKVEELGDYSSILKPAWDFINEQAQKIKKLEEHIAWLNNVGGRQLNRACGIDILGRDMALARAQSKGE